MGAAGPLVLEYGNCFLFFFVTTIFTTHVYQRFYHKLLSQTTIIIGVSISTTTPIFVPIQQFFNFTTHFTTPCQVWVIFIFFFFFFFFIFFLNFFFSFFLVFFYFFLVFFTFFTFNLILFFYFFLLFFLLF